MYGVCPEDYLKHSCTYMYMRARNSNPGCDVKRVNQSASACMAICRQHANLARAADVRALSSLTRLVPQPGCLPPVPHPSKYFECVHIGTTGTTGTSGTTGTTGTAGTTCRQTHVLRYSLQNTSVTKKACLRLAHQ